MGKRKKTIRRSGHPGHRAQLDPPNGLLGVYELKHLEEYDEETRTKIQKKVDASTALIRRGWLYMHSDEHGRLRHPWELPTAMIDWRPSQRPNDDEADQYYECTYFTAYTEQWDGLQITFAADADIIAPAYARYSTLEALLADIEVIEAYREGDPFPELPHAAETKPHHDDA